MDSLVLNVSEINSLVEDMRLKLNDYQESLNAYLDGIVKVDSCWNDINTQVFINIVNEEKELFKEHVDTTEKHMNFILDFCDSLQSGLNEMLDESNLNKVQYYSSTVNDALSTLDNAKGTMEEIYDIYNSLVIPASCSASYDISSLLDNIDDSKIINTKSDIENNIIKMKNVVANNREEANALTIVTIDDKICELNYKANDN